MSRTGSAWRVLLLVSAAGLTLTTHAASQPGTRTVPPPPTPVPRAAGQPVPRTPTQPLPQRTVKAAPRLEAVAETRLLMEGINQANFRGLERSLKQPPADADGWSFARGQALLIAENGNLLMLRPPHNQGQEVWMERSQDLREAATALAAAAGNRNYDQSLAAFNTLADTCTRCHQTFRVPVRVTPFAPPMDRPAPQEE